jgi:hypothetical protein
MLHGDALLTSGTRHLGDIRLDEVRALEENEDVIPIDEQRAQDVQFGRSATYSAGQIAKDRRFAVLKGWRDLCHTDIALGKMRITLLDLAPWRDFRARSQHHIRPQSESSEQMMLSLHPVPHFVGSTRRFQRSATSSS